MFKIDTLITYLIDRVLSKLVAYSQNWEATKASAAAVPTIMELAPVTFQDLPNASVQVSHLMVDAPSLTSLPALQPVSEYLVVVAPVVSQTVLVHTEVEPT